MARLKWTPTLSVGVDEIDRQHQELIQRINDLMVAMESGVGPERVDGLLDYLERYVVFHFGAEEELMTRHEYPKRADHVDEHAELVRDIAKLRAQHQAEGATVAFTIQVNNRVCAWLVRHIMRTDVALGAFLKSTLARSAEGGS